MIIFLILIQPFGIHFFLRLSPLLSWLLGQFFLIIIIFIEDANFLDNLAD
jgi:hypothetical protein